MVENYGTLTFTDLRGNKVSRKINRIIDVRDFVDTPGYSLPVLAANTNLSVPDVERFLSVSREGAGRSLSWIQRRRWLFQVPGTDNRKGSYSDLDGNAARASEIMLDNPVLSIRALTLLLKEHGIIRSREWVRKHRCSGL